MTGQASHEVDSHGSRAREGAVPRSSWQSLKWPVAIGIVATTLLGWAGFAERYPDQSTLDHLYQAICLFVFEAGVIPAPVPWQLQVARFAAPVVTGLTVAVAMLTILRERVQLMRARRMRDQVLVCGLGSRGVLIATRFAEAGYRVACVESDENNPHIALCRERGIPVLVADATDPYTLGRLGVGRAKYLLAVTGDDYRNAAIAGAARTANASRRRGTLACLADIESFDLCALLRESVLAATDDNAYSLRLMNIQEAGARIALRVAPPRTRVGHATHVVIIGLGQMGRALALSIAEEHRQPTAGPLRFTFIDARATVKIERLNIRYPWLSQVCTMRALDLEKGSPEFERCEYLFDTRGTLDVDAVFLCFEEDALAVNAAITVARHLTDTEIPLLVRVQMIGGLDQLLPKRENLHLFDLLDRACAVESFTQIADQGAPATCSTGDMP